MFLPHGVDVRAQLGRGSVPPPGSTPCDTSMAALGCAQLGSLLSARLGHPCQESFLGHTFDARAHLHTGAERPSVRASPQRAATPSCLSFLLRVVLCADVVS